MCVRARARVRVCVRVCACATLIPSPSGTKNEDGVGRMSWRCSDSYTRGVLAGWGAAVWMVLWVQTRLGCVLQTGRLRPKSGSARWSCVSPWPPGAPGFCFRECPPDNIHQRTVSGWKERAQVERVGTVLGACQALTGDRSLVGLNVPFSFPLRGASGTGFCVWIQEQSLSFCCSPITGCNSSSQMSGGSCVRG